MAFVAKHPITPTAAVIKYRLSDSRTAYSPASAAEALDCMYAYVDEITPMAIPGAERIAYIEAPVVAGARNLQSTIKQAFINGIVQGVFTKAGFTVHLVPVSTWKMVVCGNGRADKQQVAAHLERVWPVVSHVCAGDQDLIDAATVCMYGGEVERSRRAG